MLTHEQVQAAISAQLDGEAPQLSPDVIEAHVSSCPDCAAFRDKAAALSRSLSLVEPDGAPPQDLSEVILAGVEPEWQRASSTRQASLSLARVALGVLSVAFLVWAIVVVVSASGLTTLESEGTLAEGADPERARLLIEAAALRFGLASGLVLLHGALPQRPDCCRWRAQCSRSCAALPCAILPWAASPRGSFISSSAPGSPPPAWAGLGRRTGGSCCGTFIGRYLLARVRSTTAAT